MVVPDPPLSGKQDKDAVVQIASTLAPTPSQEFSQLKGCYSSLTSQGDSPVCPDQGFSDIITNTSHLSNLAIFAKNKTESVWKNKYRIISKVRAGSQCSSNSCPQKYVRNKNLNFDVKYGIACAIPELYAEDTYSGQNYTNSDYIDSASFYDTPVTYSHHDISTGVNSSLSSSRYKTSNFPLISVGKGLHHQVEGERVQFSQSVYNAQDLQESSSVTSDSSKNRWKNKNSKLRKEAFSTLKTDAVKNFFCLYGKIVHTDDCKCLKINLWKRCLLPVCYPSKVSYSDTTAFDNVYQNNLDEDVYDVQVSSLSEEVTPDTNIGVSAPKSDQKRIHSEQSCTTNLEPICESAKETDKHLNEFGLEADLGIGEEITQQYNTGTADLRVFFTETVDTVLSSVYQTHNYSSREDSQTSNYSSREESQTHNYSSREESQTRNYNSREESQTCNYSSGEESQTRNYNSREESQTRNYSSGEESQTHNYTSREESQSPFLSESKSLKVEHFRHSYDSVKNLPFKSATSRAANFLTTGSEGLTTGSEGKVQVIEPSQLNALSEASAGLTQSLHNLVDVVQHSQTKHNIKASERPATQDDLAPYLALFDNLINDIDNRLEQVPYTGESSIDEEFGLDPWVAISSQSTTKMASQGKKNKNQFVRKAAPSSPKIGEGGSSGSSTPDVTNIQMNLVEVGIDSAALSTGQKDRNVTNKIESTQESPLEFALEQHGIPSNASVGDASHKLRQKYDLGGFRSPSSVNVQYSDGSSSVPTVHSHPYSSPNTGNNSQSAYPDSTGSSGTPPLYKTQSPVPPAKPPRTFQSEILDQHSASSMHKESQLGSAQILGDTFSNAQQFSRLQKQGSQQFANNFDDDQWHPSTASEEDIQLEYLEEQARVQYEGPEILFNNGQKGNSDQSTLLQTQVGQNLPFYMNEQKQGQIPSMHFSKKTQYSSVEHKPSGQHEGMIPRVPNAGKMGQTSSGHQDSWMDEMESGQNSGQMEQQQSGFHGDRQQEGLKQMPGMKHGKSKQPVQNRLQDGILGQMHPHAQLNAMQLNEKGFKENVQGVQSQQGYMAQDGYSSDTYSHGEGTSYHTGKSSYMTDKELAHEQLDQRMNNPWFREMVQNMKELVEREGLVVKDVFPDGNCLFTAVVDQLRVHGNFKYTPSTLRAAAVNYLKENSKQRDGTPLEHFLLNETWENYLVRMSRDGEWGEHIILGAISEVLRCRINVLGGMSGKSCTVVQPQHMSDKEEEEREKKRMETKDVKTASDSQTANSTVSESQAADKTISDNKATDTAKSDKSTFQDETNSETSQAKAGLKSASYQTGDQPKSLHTGASSLPKQTDAKTESTDTSQRKDQSTFCSKQNWDKENEELSQGEELFIGLLGEMHYVSLRKKDWEERLHEKLWARIKRRKEQRNGRSADGSSSDDDMCLPEDPIALLSTDIVVDPASGEHLPHLDFILKRVSESPFFKTSRKDPHAFNNCNVHGEDYTKQIVGFYISELERLPSVDQPQMRTLFSMEFLHGAIHEYPTCSLEKSVILAHYFSPHDTKIILKKKGSAVKHLFELVLETKGCQEGYVKLCPVNVNVWRNNLASDETGKLYLKHIYVDAKWNTSGPEKKVIPNFIAFVCPWPSEANKWFTRKKPSKWICGCATQRSNDSCHIIPVSHKKSSNSKIEWKLSFSVAEDWVINHCLKQYHTKVFHLLKFLISTQVKEETKEFRDLIRHTFFYACDRIKMYLWNQMPGRCILYIITDLLQKLKSGFVPHYFMATINLIDHLSEEARISLVKKLKLLRYSPTICTYIFLDRYKLTYTELIKEFNSAIDDSERLYLHGDIKQSKRQFFIPQCIRKVCSLIAWQMYGEAENECFSAFEEMTSIENVISFNDCVEQVLSKLPITDRWCFAFHLDYSQRSCLLRNVCEVLPTEPLVSLFGPDIVCNLRELNVPSQSVCPQNVIDFVEKFTNILVFFELHPAVVVGLNFFLTLIYDQSTGVYTYRNVSLETVHHSDIGSHSCSICSCQKVSPQNVNLTHIALLYQRFYYSCYHAKKMNVFQPFQQRFGLICEILDSQHFYEILSEMHERYERLYKGEGIQQTTVKETMI